LENTEKAKNAAIEKAMQIWNRSTGTIISLENIHYSCWTTRAKPEDPLSNNGVFRESLLDLNNPGKAAPLLNLFGMNTVQHRVIAEQALEILKNFTKAKKNPAYYALTLPGGDFSEGLENFIIFYKSKLAENLHSCIERLVSTYGSLSRDLLEHFVENTQGKHFGQGLYEVEVRYLATMEWASCAEDILWRRTHLGLMCTEEESSTLDTWMKENLR
jgi:glycerol-3-phosphate dehydrogenase